MTLIFTGNDTLDEELNNIIDDSRIVYYPEYVLEENTVDNLILTASQGKFKFEDYIYKIRCKDIRVILLLENHKSKELEIGIKLGIYDIIFNPFEITDVINKLYIPSKFSDISKYIK